MPSVNGLVWKLVRSPSLAVAQPRMIEAQPIQKPNPCSMAKAHTSSALARTAATSPWNCRSHESKERASASVNGWPSARACATAASLMAFASSVRSCSQSNHAA